MNRVERLIVGIEAEPWAALYRMATGFMLAPIFLALGGGHTSAWIPSVLFLCFLVALRVVPKLLRSALPFSAEAKAVWASRRNLSKQFDSYAWQKLFWIGLGFLLYAVSIGGLRTGEYAVMAFCLIGGGAGLWLWHKARAVPMTGAAAPSTQ